MRRLTSGAQGAAACTTERSDERSYLFRTTSESLSIRTNMVGTNWACVTLCSSMSARQRSGSKCSMTTTEPPMRWAVMDHTRGAEWYSGAGLR